MDTEHRAHGWLDLAGSGESNKGQDSGTAACVQTHLASFSRNSVNNNSNIVTVLP